MLTVGGIGLIDMTILQKKSPDKIGAFFLHMRFVISLQLSEW